MSKRSGGPEEAIRAARGEIETELAATAAEVRRELSGVDEELRAELGAAGVEARRALRDAMLEARQAIRDAIGDVGSEAASARPTRMSRAERKELTRELLLDAAVEVFARKGYHGASLDDVADAAGFTKGAVYSNFATKADLFGALLGRQGSRRGAALVEAMRDTKLELLPDLAGMWLAEQAEEERDWDILTVEFWLAAMRDPEIRARLTKGRDASLSVVGGILDDKIEAAGAHPGFSGRELMIILEALGTGLLMNVYLDPEAGSSELLTRATRKLLADEDEV